MTTDRELLEMAAKAAELNFLFGKEWHNLGNPEVDGKCWNPLTDDGDALRLAVKLKMVVACYDDTCEVEDLNGNMLAFDVNADPYAATRRAIVRAAAEIGRGV